jgi:hypothetical protein
MAEAPLSPCGLSIRAGNSVLALGLATWLVRKTPDHLWQLLARLRFWMVDGKGNDPSEL